MLFVCGGGRPESQPPCCRVCGIPTRSTSQARQRHAPRLAYPRLQRHSGCASHAPKKREEEASLFRFTPPQRFVLPARRCGLTRLRAARLRCRLKCRKRQRQRQQYRRSPTCSTAKHTPRPNPTRPGPTWQHFVGVGGGGASATARKRQETQDHNRSLTKVLQQALDKWLQLQPQEQPSKKQRHHTQGWQKPEGVYTLLETIEYILQQASVEQQHDKQVATAIQEALDEHHRQNSTPQQQGQQTRHQLCKPSTANIRHTRHLLVAWTSCMLPLGSSTH